MRDLKQALDTDPDLYARVERRLEVWAHVNQLLLNENAKLGADRERLDWLQSEAVGIDFDECRWNKHAKVTLRAIIDAGRKAGTCS